MHTRIKLVATILLLTVALWAQHQHRHDMAGMNDAPTAGQLKVQDDGAGHLTVRLGPIALPASAGQGGMVQTAPETFPIPFDGWLTAYEPAILTNDGTPISVPVLHHVAFYNLERSDFLCPNHSEHIFGSGGELASWPALPGLGYRVHQGDRIRVTAMFANPSATAYDAAYLQVRVSYESIGSGKGLRDVYPAWFDVKGCGESGYDLAIGNNVTSNNITVPFSGALVGVGGHLHDYGRDLVLADAGSQKVVANLAARTDAQGHLLGVPIVTFPNGYHLDKGEILKVTVTYDNSSGHALPQGAMGIVVGYFLPDQPAQMSTLQHVR